MSDARTGEITPPKGAPMNKTATDPLANLRFEAQCALSDLIQAAEEAKRVLEAGEYQHYAGDRHEVKQQAERFCDYSRKLSAVD